MRAPIHRTLRVEDVVRGINDPLVAASLLYLEAIRQRQADEVDIAELLYQEANRLRALTVEAEIVRKRPANDY